MPPRQGRHAGKGRGFAEPLSGISSQNVKRLIMKKSSMLGKRKIVLHPWRTDCSKVDYNELLGIQPLMLKQLRWILLTN